MNENHAVEVKKYSDVLQTLIDDFTDNVLTIAFDVMDSANEEDYHEFLKVFKQIKELDCVKLDYKILSKTYRDKYGN